MNEKISVILSFYNENISLIKDSISSILNQTHQNIEVIVISDGATEELNERVEEFVSKDSRVTLYFNKENRGLPYCRNLGIKLSTGEYVAIMDSDDVAMNDRLEKQLKHIKECNCDLVFSRAKYIRGDNILGESKSMSSNLLKDIVYRKIFVHPTAFIKREIFNSDMYDNRFLKSQDIDLWLRLYSRGRKFGLLDEVLLDYHLTNKSGYEDRLEKQRGYSKYGLMVVSKHIFRFIYRPYYLLAVIRQLVYFVYTHLPKKVVIYLMKLKDNLNP